MLTYLAFTLVGLASGYCLGLVAGAARDEEAAGEGVVIYDCNSPHPPRFKSRIRLFVN